MFFYFPGCVDDEQCNGLDESHSPGSSNELGKLDPDSADDDDDCDEKDNPKKNDDMV